jgi:hypothetical protein
METLLVEQRRRIYAKAEAEADALMADPTLTPAARLRRCVEVVQTCRARLAVLEAMAGPQRE